MVSKANNRLATVVSFIALFVALIGNAATLSFSEKASAENCMYASQNRDMHRNLLLRADSTIDGNPDLSQAQKDVAHAFYQDSLAAAPPIDCEDS